MGAEKIVKINSNYELKALNDKLSVYESIIDYAVAEQMLSLKNKVKDLEDEAIALRAADAEKDKMIEEKDNQLAYIRKNFDTQLNSRLEWQRKQFEAEKNQSLSDQRKNIRAREVKPEKEKVEAANNERDRIQQMYESLLKEFNLSHENEKAILSICSEILSNIKQLINNGATQDELVEKIDSGIESLSNLTIKEECSIIHNWISNGYTKKAVASYLYPDLARREQKVQERINSKQYQEMFGHF